MRPSIVALFAVACPFAGSTHAYIDLNRPDTLGAVCERAQSVTVVKVVKVKLGDDRGAVTYRTVKDLKGKLPRDSFRQVFGLAHEADELKALRGWAKDDLEVVVFRYESRLAIYHGGLWSVTDSAPPKDEAEEWAFHTRTEPWFLRSYAGAPGELRPAVEELLAGKEVAVAVMLGGRDKELRKRDGEVVKVRASLKHATLDLARDRVK